jgi:hypothetical protein
MSESRPARVRRERGATESLLSIVLLLEAILIFFVTLVVFGLKTLPAGPAFGAGAGLFVLLLIVGRLVRWRWGIWAGWVLQAVLIAVGILVPLMYFIGAVFLAIWIYCFITGHRLDRRNAALLAEHLVAEQPKENP